MAYIDREEAISQLRRCKEERAKRRAILVADEDEIIKWLNKFPAADVAPVVRCQQCRQGEESAEIQGLVYCNRFYRNMHPAEFCSFGEKDDESRTD